MAGSVRLEPPFVEFNDVRTGQVYKTTVTATNTGTTSRKIRIEKPASKLFRFTASSPAVTVAPGLSVGGLLEFTPEEEEEVRDCLLVHIDDTHILKIPLLGMPQVCSLFMDSLLDFGCVVASSQVIRKHHPITNQGSAPGGFHVQFSGDSSIHLSPCSGVIAAGATQWLKVELRTDRPKHIHETAQVKLQSRPAVALSIRAEVVDQDLEIFDLQGSPLSCLWFGLVYLQTSCVENVVLRNNSPEPCDWVCRLQAEAAGTEAGTDLQKSTGAALLERAKKCRQSTTCDLTQVFACVPKEGRLGPYGKTTVAVRFSPVCNRVTKWSHNSSSARQDYCVFLLFESVGSKHGFTNHHAPGGVELAVTGSGLPLAVVVRPSDRFDFLSCSAGQCVNLQCVLQNLCPQLPISFTFRKLVHFTTKPSSGTVGPGQCQDVVLSFRARQQGSFQVLQKLDILGYVTSRSNDKAPEDNTKLEYRSFHTITLHFSAVCLSETTYPLPRINLVSGSVGSRPCIKRSELAGCRGSLRAVILSADKTVVHKQCRERSHNTEEEEEELLAFPNDRPSSIRPASPHRLFRTIFTGIPRYRYVDSTYAFTDEEEEWRKQHRQNYADFITKLRQKRLQKVKERKPGAAEWENVDAGTQGLVPPRLRIRDLEKSDISGTIYNYNQRQKVISITQQAPDVMTAVPRTSQQVADCEQSLTAQELHQVLIGPLSVDFGEVCVHSVCVHQLQLVNGLSKYVLLQLEVDHPELQGSSPLSHVLPPCSHSTLPLTFHSNKLGPFYGPVSYCVNQKHPGQILVQAIVVPPALELSPTLLVLPPTPGRLAASCYRSSVTLRNPRNLAAEFTWRPVVTTSGILFSVRPATGVVEPYQELDCEVVWYPSFSSPAEGDFDLCVHEGNSQRLHCVAKVGTTRVRLAEKCVSFRSVPLNLPCSRTAVLHNMGPNHAYYQVSDTGLLPGMIVSPSKGMVPNRGQTELHIHFSPDRLLKFDTRLEIALRNMESIELRVGGAVELPNVQISVSCFQFGGVHAGSQGAVPFTLTNRSSPTARVTFDLSEYPDFSLQLPQPSANRYVVDVQGFQTVDCCLVFSPTQIARFDFELPLTINGLRRLTAPSSPPSFSSSSSSSSLLTAGSRKHTVKTLEYSAAMLTPCSPCVQATVLWAPLELSPSSLHFHMETQTNSYTQKVELKAASEDSLCWQALGGGMVHWWFGHQGAVCDLSPSSGSVGPGQSLYVMVNIRPEAIREVNERVGRVSLPLYLGEEGEEARGVEQQAYRELQVTLTLQPTITFLPPQILLTPQPLNSRADTTLTLLLTGYPRGTSVTAEVGEVELEDGTKVRPVSVVFPEGNAVPPQDQWPGVASLLCAVAFCSGVPLSLCTTIKFTDHLHNRFVVQLYGVTDNCLLTVWPYLALHRSDQQIVLKTVATAVEAILQPYRTPSPASAATSSSSSFNHNSSTDKTPDSYPDSDSVSGCATTATDGPSSSVGFPEFPAADSAEGLYHQSVLQAVESWFSLFGWPGGSHGITVPHTFRRVTSKTLTEHSSRQAHYVSQNQESRSVVEMLCHLTGGQIPGIPRYQTFSADVDQRIDQLLQQHATMLDFLRAQGARICHIRPPYLLDVLEFKHWTSRQSKDTKPGVNYSHLDYESLSKRCWTDLLVQIYKVFVLCSVTDCGGTSTLSHAGDVALPTSSLTVSSNIYSPQELLLLSWLNSHYHRMRDTVWTGRVPSARWIVNFDLDLTDGLVLAALLAAYCPYLVESYFRRMYTAGSTLEQILHNNILLIRALTALCLNINIQPTDLSDPNPVQMLMLCVHLHEKLPQYLPIHTISLSGSLHSTFTKQVRLKNPSSKPLNYKASLFGEDAHLFSLPDGSTVSIPPKSSSEVSLHFRCSFLHPMEAVLLFTPTLALGRRCSAIAFALKTQVTHILPAKNVKCKIPCYQLAEIQVPILNTFNEDATFRVVLLESTSNPLKSETITDSLLLQGSSKDNLEKIPSDGPSGELAEEREDKEFLTSVTSVYLKPRQESTLIIHHLPFCPGTKFCSVLLKCPQVGDLVYLVKATSEPPLPSPLSARPSSNIIIPSGGSDRDACVPVLILRCEVARPCEEVLRLPRVNMQWEQALAIRGQWHMGAEERRRRTLTHTLHSSSVRTGKDQQKLWKPPQVEGVGQREVQYQVEVSLPQHFTLPPTVTIPVEEDTTILWGDHADCDYVDVPMRFQADLEGKFSCKVVLRSSSDTRVYLLEALVTSQTQSDSLRSGCEGAEQVLPVRGAIERPLPVEHVVLHCPLGRTTHTQLEVPNSTLKKLTLKVLTDLSVVSGPSSLEVPAGLSAAYSLAVSPWRRGAQTGYVSFVESGDIKETGKENGNILRCYVVNFSLEILCEPAEPVKVIHVQCETRSSVAIAIPIYNPMGETLRLDVDLDGDDLSGSSRVSLAPRETLTYTATFTPSRVGRSVGSVVFQSLVVREFWYQLQLSALPPPLLTSPQSRLEVDPPVLSVVSPLCRIPVDDAPLAELQCEVGQRLEKEVQVWLTGAGNQGREEDFLCEVRSDGKEEECLSASVQAVRTDPETETLTLILQLVYTPHRAGRSCGVLAVRSVSGEVWEFPVSLSAVEPQADDIILMEATKLGTTSTVAFRLTSTTRSSESFTAAFLPGSSSEFRVSPASGLLPPAGTSGALLRVSFTPSASSHSHRAMLAIQAADMRWIYEVKGETSSTSSSTQASSDLHHPSKDQNFVVGNLQLPSLANSSPLKVSK